MEQVKKFGAAAFNLTLWGQTQSDSSPPTQNQFEMPEVPSEEFQVVSNSEDYVYNSESDGDDYVYDSEEERIKEEKELREQNEANAFLSCKISSVPIPYNILTSVLELQERKKKNEEVQRKEVEKVVILIAKRNFDGRDFYATEALETARPKFSSNQITQITELLKKPTRKNKIKMIENEIQSILQQSESL